MPGQQGSDLVGLRMRLGVDVAVDGHPRLVELGAVEGLGQSSNGRLHDRGVERAGYRVPDDVSVMGMDDLPQAAFHNPPLSTVHIPMREIGGVALDLLLDSIDGFTTPPRRVELACQIVERQSTAVVPSPPATQKTGT